jgi:hypothetical protein
MGGRSESRVKWAERIKEVNLEYGTSFTNRTECIHGLRERFGIKETSRVLCVSETYVSQEARAFLMRNKKDAAMEWRESAGPDIEGPWKDAKRSPCLACRWRGRSKHSFGCTFNCELRVQYDRLLMGVPSILNVDSVTTECRLTLDRGEWRR